MCIQVLFLYNTLSPHSAKMKPYHIIDDSWIEKGHDNLEDAEDQARQQIQRGKGRVLRVVVFQAVSVIQISPPLPLETLRDPKKIAEVGNDEADDE